MRINKTGNAFVVVAVAVTAVFGLLTLTVGSSKTSSIKQHGSHEQRAEVPVLPVVRYESSGTGDKVSVTLRRQRSSRYDKRELVREDPNVSIVSSNGHWGIGLPALPITQSDLVIVGQVIDARAYLSTDKSGIYSEFTIEVEDLYRGADSHLIGPGKSIAAAREGGAVKFPSGHLQQYIVAHQGMPQVGGRYLLFLTRDEAGQSFDILTGYELRNAKVRPLDSLGTFAVYDGVDEVSFLSAVRNSLHHPWQ